MRYDALQRILFSALFLLIIPVTLAALPPATPGAQPSDRQPSQELRYRNSRLTLILARNNEGVVYLKDLRLNGRASMITPPPEVSRARVAPLWDVQFEGRHIVNSNWANFSGWEIHGNRLEVRWVLWNVEITMGISVEDSTTFWDMQLRSLDGNTFVVQQINFPMLGDLQREGTNLAVPYGWGREYRLENRVDYNYVYPSRYAAMQFVAYYRRDSGDALYLAAHDSSGIQKRFEHWPGSEAVPFARFKPAIIPEKIATRAWRFPYRMEVRPYRGGWYQAARFYRRFVRQWQPENHRKPAWLLNNDFFMLGYLNPDPLNTFRNSDLHVREILDELGIDGAALHLYNWFKYPFDDHYPDYFPPREGFEDFLAEMKSLNVRVLPYINGRLVDARLARADSIYFRNACLYAPGKFFYSRYNNNEFLAACPNTAFWQGKMQEITNRLLAYGVDGIYYDQVATEPSWKCVNPAHGHTPDQDLDWNMASGNRWVRGINRIVDQPTVTMSEDNGEPYRLDMHLMYNMELTDPENSFEVIPLYPVAFSGRTLTVGFGVHWLAKQPFLPAALLKLSLTLLYGAQIGRLAPDELLRNRPLLAFVKKLLAVRSAYRDYFNFGEMLAPPRVSGGRSTVTEQLTGYNRAVANFEHEKVLCALWRYRNGYLLMATNHTGESSGAAVSIALPAGRYRRISGDGEISQIRSAGSVTERLTVPAEGVLSVEYFREP